MQIGSAQLGEIAAGTAGKAKAGTAVPNEAGTHDGSRVILLRVAKAVLTMGKPGGHPWPAIRGMREVTRQGAQRQMVPTVGQKLTAMKAAAGM